MPSATIPPATSTAAAPTAVTSTTAQRNAPPAAPAPRATDDEILGIVSSRKNAPRDARQLEFDFDATDPADGSRTAGLRPASLPSAIDASTNTITAANAPSPEPAHLRATFDANPELRAAWRDAGAYRESFATPEAARQATALLADVNHMDALFFSRRPEDHATLARAVANLDPAAFASLANAMNTLAAGAQSQISSVGARHAVPSAANSANHVSSANVAQVFRPEGVERSEQSLASKEASYIDDSNAADDARQLVSGGRSFSSDITARAERDSALPQAVAEAASPQRQSSPLAQSTATTHDAQLAFLNAANAATVEGVVAAIESQVERLLPAGVAKNARTRVVGEIYRELDSSLRENPQFAAQLRDAFRSGSLDDGHHRAIVSLLTGRARQALPGVAKRVLNEWTSTIVSAANERRTRQRTAERRVDIAGSGGAGNDGRRSMSPRDLDYARLTDADILNL
jgi:hypothetical protein